MPLGRRQPPWRRRRRRGRRRRRRRRRGGHCAAQWRLGRLATQRAERWQRAALGGQLPRVRQRPPHAGSDAAQRERRITCFAAGARRRAPRRRCARAARDRRSCSGGGGGGGGGGGWRRGARGREGQGLVGGRRQVVRGRGGPLRRGASQLPRQLRRRRSEVARAGPAWRGVAPPRASTSPGPRRHRWPLPRR